MKLKALYIITIAALLFNQSCTKPDIDYTYEIKNLHWTDEGLDHDLDGYATSRTLECQINLLENVERDIVIKVYYKLSETRDYIFYHSYEKPGFIGGADVTVLIPVGLVKELTEGTYSFLVEVYEKDSKRLEQALFNQGKELDIVRKTIEKFIPEYKNLRVERSPIPRMLIEKNGEILNLNQLSDGEKNMIAMVGDIARRLSMANPNLENPLEGDGIVMIDEVDLHLHPHWQQKILFNLEQTFPNIQFIVTTHSPQVLTTIKSKGIQGLVYENGNLEIKKFNFSLGAKSHELLYEILGVQERPQIIPIVQILNHYLELVDENLYNSEEAMKLREKLDDWGAGEEKDLLNADMDIRLKEYRRKKHEKS